MTEHPWHEHAPAYALGALDPADRAAFEEHLAGCDLCRADVARHRTTTDLLARAAPDVAPPAALRARVLGDAARVRPLRRRGSGLPWLLAAASLVIALGVGAIWARDRAQWRETIAAARAELATRDSTIAALLGSEVHLVTLTTSGREPRVRVFWNHDRDVFVVTAFDLPAAAPGRTYQLWALASGQAPVSMGTFDTDSTGRAVLVLPVEDPVLALGLLDACALTEEPAGGSPGPTAEPRFVGHWRHAS